jgi:trimeric autotransporter adhesin
MRFSFVTRLLLLFAAAVVLASCGGHSSATTDNTPASITASPSTFSMAHGDVAQFSSVQVLNSSNAAVTTTPTITYTSSDPTSVTVTSAGIICAGVFDANNVVCKTTDANGAPLPDKTVNITVAGGGVSTTVQVFVHTHVDNVKVLGPAVPPACVSQNQTEQFTAQAFSGGQDITSKVGPFTWSTGNSVVATVDLNGVVTSRQPGATTVVASVTNPTGASTTGTPGVVIACPPKSISLHVSGAADTTFSVASGTAETLVADVTDVLGQPITGAALTFSSFLPTVASITSTGAVSTPGAGVTTLVASCSPPSCNPAAGNFNGTGTGLTVYSNPVIGTVTGTTATTIYVTGSDNPDGSANMSLIPIDSAANTAGTAITLSGSPNSMVFNRSGTTAYIGSSTGLLVFDPGTNAVTATASGLTGKVLAVSNDGNKVIISDTSVSPGSVGKVFVFDTAANTSQEFDLAGVTAADFDSDNSKAYFTSGSAVYEYSPALSERQLSFPADGVVFAPQAAAAFFGGGSFLALATCNDSALPGAAGVANILAVTPDGSHMVGAGTAGWVDLSYSIANANGCPPTATNSVRSASSPFAAAPTQIAAASDDSNAFVTGFAGAGVITGVPFYHFGDGTTGAIALAGSGGPLFSGGLTQDAHSLYVGVGGASPQVHRIDLTAAGGPADANQINVTFNPRIVVVRPK